MERDYGPETPGYIGVDTDGHPLYEALTLEEAAALLGVAASTLRVQLRNGKLHGSKVGPVWTVTTQEVERYRTESRRTA